MTRPWFAEGSAATTRSGTIRSWLSGRDGRCILWLDSLMQPPSASCGKTAIEASLTQLLEEAREPCSDDGCCRFGVNRLGQKVVGRIERDEGLDLVKQFGFVALEGSHSAPLLVHEKAMSGFRVDHGAGQG